MYLSILTLINIVELIRPAPFCTQCDFRATRSAAPHQHMANARGRQRRESIRTAVRGHSRTSICFRPSFLPDGGNEGREGRRKGEQPAGYEHKWKRLDWVRAVSADICVYVHRYERKMGNRAVQANICVRVFFFVGVNFRDSEISMLSKQQF